MGHDRSYRNLIQSKNLLSYRVVVKETDIHVQAGRNLDRLTRELVLKHRGYIESYIENYPDFAMTLVPWRFSGPMPIIIRDMVKAGETAGVGPMAAVAGAIAEHVGKDLLSCIDEVIIENGGDIFIKANDCVTVGIFAGKSPLSLRLGLRIDSTVHPVSVCTSSGTFGHSLSMGKADAVCVIARSCPLADAAATAIGNRVRFPSDFRPALDFGKSIRGITGILVIKGAEMGCWGDITLVSLP